MAKMTRDSLKSLVKECLFEILLEATGDASESLNEAKTPRKRKTSKRSPVRRPALDNTMVGTSKPTPARPAKVDVSGITSDPVMAAIFQDTAATTLVEQAQAESRPGHATPGRMDQAARTVAQNDPSDLFGAASKNWAALAFND